MNVKINLTHLFTALFFAIVVSAVIHLYISLFLALTTGNPDYANMFNILGISHLFPALGAGGLNAVIGMVFVIGIGVFVYYYLEYKNKSKKK